MPLSEHVETYRFWDVVTLWAKERLEHEEIVARALAKALAKAVVRDGLILNSIDPKFIETKDGGLKFRGAPYVGYCAIPNGDMAILRAETLEHLLAVVRKAKTPSRALLHQEFISKESFKIWLENSGESLPEFWYGRA